MRLALLFAGLFAFHLSLAHADSPPMQVNNLKAEFRNGQTFLTWHQVPPANLVSYRIYRKTSSAPFTQADLTSDTLIGKASGISSLNLWASINRMQLSQQKPGQEYVMPKRVQYVIKEGDSPLDENTGVFVYTAKANESALYAVTAVIDKSEVRTVDAGLNTLSSPVEEKVEPVEPVKQNEDNEYVHWTDNIGTAQYPAMSSIPSMAYNFNISPPKGQGPYPVHLLLHGALFQYNTPTAQRAEALNDPNKIAVFADAPALSTGGRGREFKVKGITLPPIPSGAWYGYNENWGTGKPMSEGKVVPYHAQRVLWEMHWAEKKFNGDPQRLYVQGGSMGGYGSTALALLYPNEFAAVKSMIPFYRNPMSNWARRPAGSASSNPASSAASRPAMPSRSSSSDSSFMPVQPADYVAEHPDTDYPYIIIIAGRTDNITGWKDKIEFVHALEKNKIAYTFYWNAGGHGGGGAPVKEENAGKQYVDNIPKLDMDTIRKDQSFPALAHCSLNNDPGTVDIAVRADIRPPLDTPGVGDLVGTFNGAIQWDPKSIKDEAEQYQLALKVLDFAKNDKGTVDVTPRHTQAFKPQPGSSWRYEVKDQAGAVLTSGTAQADEHGFVTVEKMPVSKEGVMLSIIK